MDRADNYGRRKTLIRLMVGIGFLIFLIVGISSCNFPNFPDLISGKGPTEIPGIADNSPTPAPSSTPNAPLSKSKDLIIWVPPQFDPGDGSTAANLFLSRLDEFTSRRPQTDIQVRVKSLSGEDGLLESLRTTRAAAPIILPDLIALPRSLMEEAINDGLVLPLNDITEVLNGDDWYGYASNLSLVNDQVTGIPFAGDLLVLAYKNDTGETPPSDWNAVLKTKKALAFPASDPRSLVTLAHYQSLGQEVIDETGEIILLEEPLLEVLTYYQQAQAANVMPYWLTQFETDDQAWLSYQERQSTLAITWSSTLLGSDSANTDLAAMPTKGGKAFAYAEGWVWCVIPSDSDTEQVAVELAEFLTAESYLSAWAIQAGYLPVRPSGLESWSEQTSYSTISQLLPSAVLIPDLGISKEIGLDIRDAVVAVLKDQIEPSTALAELFESTQVP